MNIIIIYEFNSKYFFMNWKIFLILKLFIIITLNSLTLYSKDKQIFVNNKLTLIEITAINNVEYIELCKLGNILNKRIDCDNINLSIESETLKFNNSSFYAVYEKNKSLRVAQLSLPCITYNQNLLIPWHAFLTAFQGLNLLQYSFEGGNLKIKTEMFESGETAIPIELKTEEIKEKKPAPVSQPLKNTNKLNKRKFKYSVPETLKLPE